MRKISIILLAIFFLSSFISIALAAYSYIPELLCDLGLKFYQQGRYDEALHEFKKALLAEPGYAPALKYIQMIEGVADKVTEPIIPRTVSGVDETLELIEIQREMMKQGSPLPEKGKLLGTVAAVEEKIISAPQILMLDASFENISQPIEIEQTKSIVVVGKNIYRFLVTQPEIIAVEKESPDRLLVTAKDIGYAYLHIWDNNGRWTIEFLGVPLKPTGPTYGETLRRKEELARNFKLRYSLSWSSLEVGRRLSNLKQTTKPSISHSLGINGETPYGNLSSAVGLQKFKTRTELTYANLGLTEGKLGRFEDFALHAGDFSSQFSNLSFPGSSLRGVSFDSPAFNKELEYNIFWGRENRGGVGLSSELYKSRHSFLEGVNLSYTPPLEKQNYRFSLVRGYGRDREYYLNDYGYDAAGNWNFDKWGLGYEMAYDSATFGHLLTTHYTQPRLRLTTELRDISKNFLSLIGSGWHQGELGGLFNLDYTPNEKLNISNRLDVYRGRLYPAEDNDNRWNEDFDYTANYRLDPLTNLDFNYMLQNRLGQLFQFRYQNYSLGAYRTIKWLRDIYTSATYSHQENKAYSSPSVDYTNEKVNLGLRFSLIGDLYYYLNKELNWLQEEYNHNRARPNALETGVNWSGQFGQSPLHGNLRFRFRDEEDTASSLSFFSGEDYIEGYSELSYRQGGDKEIYGSCRVRNSWADNPSISKRIEANFNAGMRYVWDTGLHWDALCNIEVYAFRDLNSDGLRQRDEPPVEGIKIWLGKDKNQVTDLFGYCKFKGVRGRKSYVSIDMSTLPAGFLVTVPANQEVVIAHNQTIRLYFGIMSHSEIRGVVFEDDNGNGEYERGEKGIAGVAISLEDGRQATTDGSGSYSFVNASTGEHTINLDLNSLPVYYLPKTTLTKKIILFEGVTYIYNIPLKRIKE